MYFMKLFSLIFLIFNHVFTSSASLECSTMSECFSHYKIVPDVIETLPYSVLNMSWPCGVVADMGNVMESKDIVDTPQCTWYSNYGEYYTLIFFDPDSNHGFIHWLVVNINNHDDDASEVILDYVNVLPLLPPRPHRYIALVYEQPSRINFSDIDSKTKYRVLALNDFTSQYNMLGPVAGNFIMAVVKDI